MAATRERLKFLDYDFQRLPNGRCRSKVVLEWRSGENFVGEAEGLGSEAAELRCSAQATVSALVRAVKSVERDTSFELLGVKAVRAFDATVVIVSLSCRDEGKATRLVGSCLAVEEVNRGAVLAVLNATNRMLGNIVFMR